MAMNDTYDPRTEFTHEIEAGQVYEDSRSGDRMTLLFTTEEIALLRDMGASDHDAWHRHRLETRSTFEKNVGSRRYSLTGESETSDRAQLESLKAQYASQSGRTASHKEEALKEALGLLSGDISPDGREDVPFEEIDGVGAKTAQNLRDAGYTLRMDIRRADDAELLEIGGVGAGNLENIREYIQ